MPGAESEIRFLVRQAGLPAEAAAPFRSEACRDRLERIRVLEQENRARRAALVAALEGIIGGAPDASRHFWLAIKRDCFNGRSLAKYAADPAFAATPAEIRDGCTEVDAGDSAIERALAEFEGLFASEKIREARDLLVHLDDPRFLRGVAMSSGSLTDYLPRLKGRQVENYGRREHRLVSSLIRYVTRAALKLSPFSTLTCVGLGRLFEPAEDSAPRLATAKGWRERSQVRMQRLRIDQLLAMLTRHPPLRAHLPLQLNPTAQAVDADGRFLYLKGPTWDLDPETGLLRAAPYSIVNVRLRGPFVAWLRERLAGGGLPYGQVAASYRAERPAAAAEDLGPTLDRLLEIGFLEFVRPCHTADPHPEKRLLEMLGAMPPDEAAAPLLASLAAIVEGEELYCRAADPFELTQELRRRIRGALGQAADLAGFDSGIATRRDHRTLHEDVFLEAGGAEPEIARLAAGQQREIVGNLQLFARLSSIRSTQAEFLHSAAAFAAEKWSGQSSLPFYQFFEAVNPLFGAYSKHDQSSSTALPDEAVPFNPYGLAALQRLHEARQRLSAGLPGCLIEGGEEEAELDRDAVLRLIDGVPAPYNRPRDFSAIVQPLDDLASSWALNMMAEGRGRLSSRFTATMDPAMRSRFAEPFVEASRWQEDGREVELVDLYCSAGHSANVHAPITRRVFQLPGDSSGLPPERHLRLSDLRVAWRGREELPELVDSEGRKILPAHLGSVAILHMPRLVRLLAAFGPGGFYFRRPTLPTRKHPDGTAEAKRHRIGNVVYRRRTWLVPLAPLAAAVAGLRAAAAHRHVDDWRLTLGMPERVYVHEAIAIGPSPYTKPQYVDFTSPHLVEIFCAILKADIPRLQIVEALPAPGRQLRGNDGGRRAVEVHLESI